MAFVKLVTTTRWTFLVDVGDEDPDEMIMAMLFHDVVRLGPRPGAERGPDVYVQTTHIVTAEADDAGAIDTRDPVYGFSGVLKKP